MCISDNMKYAQWCSMEILFLFEVNLFICECINVHTSVLVHDFVILWHIKIYFGVIQVINNKSISDYL